MKEPILPSTQPLGTFIIFEYGDFPPVRKTSYDQWEIINGATWKAEMRDVDVSLWIRQSRGAAAS